MAADHSDTERCLVEQVHRDEWGRLLALLVARFRRLDLAEDGLAEAFEAAARSWPDDPPHNPQGWLLTAARRNILDRMRAEAVAARKFPLLVVDADLAGNSAPVMADAGERLVDERLRLVLLCAIPRCLLRPRRRSPSDWCSASPPRMSPGCSWSSRRRCRPD